MCRFRRAPPKWPQVLKGWVIRWGADLGLGEDAFGKIRKEGQAGGRLADFAPRDPTSFLFLRMPEFRLCEYAP